MAAKTTTTRHNNVPGAIYLNKNRYWYKVQLPGEAKPAARPLVPHGSQYATTDYAVAVELAQNIYQQSIYTCQTATKVRKEMGYETAGATLGHTNMSATAIYAERNQGLADEAARRLG